MTEEEREAYWRRKRKLGERRNRFMWRLKEAMYDEYGNKRVSVAAIINATGVSWATFSAWERGQRIPRRQSLVKMANVLKVSPYWLLGEES